MLQSQRFFVSPKVSWTRMASFVLQSRSFSGTRKTQTMVGFIGLGRMGLPMALNLSQSFEVMGYDASSAAQKAAKEGGIKIAKQISDIQKNEEIDTIITMLPSCAAVDSVMSELLQNSKERLFIDSSTVASATSRRWNDKAKAQGSVFIDAPVSGGVKGAKDKTLTFMVGSDTDEALERAKEYLESMGSRIFHCGYSGTGSATKICNNLALATQMIGICEAMNLGESLGVDPGVLARVMNNSTAKCWSTEVNNPHPKVGKEMAKTGAGPPSSREYEGGFASSLMRKDLGLAVESARQEKVLVPLTSLAEELYAELSDSNSELSTKDFGVLLQYLKGRSPDEG